MAPVNYSYLYKTAPQALALVLEWRLFPLRTAHSDHVPKDFESPVLRALHEKSRRYERALNRRFLHRERGVDWDDGYGFPESWLLVLDTAWLQKVIFLLGLVNYGKAIAREIQGGRVRALKSLLGGEAYQFALKKAPFLGGHAVVSKSLPPDLKELPQLCLREGIGVFKKIVEPLSKGSRERLQLKLPSTLGEMWEEVPSSPSAKADLEELVGRVLRAEARGENAWFFS